MLLLAFVKFAAWVVDWMVAHLPVASPATVQTFVTGSVTFLRYYAALNTWFPFTEAISATGVYLTVYGAVSTFGLVRRTFSLFWPGAGS